MNDPETNFEQNLARTLRASFGPETVPAAAAREQLRLRLMAAYCQQNGSEEFPTIALGFLTALMFVLLAAWSVCAGTGAAHIAGRLASNPIFVIAIVNGLGVPIASLAIVLRRKYA